MNVHRAFEAHIQLAVNRSAEWLMLTLAVYFHDLGMVVTKDEYEKRETSSFKNYKNEVLSGMENQSMLNLLKNKTNIFCIKSLLEKIMQEE